MRRHIRIFACILGICCLLMGRSVTASADTLSLETSARSAVMMDGQSGRIFYQKDAHTQRPMASTTKIMTALIATERLDWDKDIIVSSRAVAVEGSALGLRGGDKITAGDLITGMMLTSGNDAANAIAEAVSGDQASFAALMNKRAQDIGMTHTHFVTPSGLDGEGHLSTAYDMALLAKEALKNERLASVFAMKTATIRLGDPKRTVTVSNHNKLLSFYPDAIGIKTGFTKKAGRCLVSAAKRDGVTLIAVTLHCPDDWDDHMRLYDAAFALTESIPLPSVVLPTVPVAGSAIKEAKLTSPTPPTVSLFQGDQDRMTVRVELPRFVFAGGKQGDIVGQIRYSVWGRELASLPIKLEETLPEQPIAPYFTQVWRLFSQMIEGLLRW